MLSKAQGNFLILRERVHELYLQRRVSGTSRLDHLTDLHGQGLTPIYITISILDRGLGE